MSESSSSPSSPNETTSESDASAAPEPLAVTSSLPGRSWPLTTVADLMTRKIITLREDDEIGDLEGWMTRFRFRHLPVVGAEMKLVGLITRTDYLHALLGVGPDGVPMAKADTSTLAGAIMSKNVVTARPEYLLTTAARAMLTNKLGCLPVVLEDNTLVGILTETDFARLAVALMEHKG